jgi:membrane protein DedA with SNARE-associated domain
MVAEQIILRFGYVALGLGTFFEGETVVVAAGALAHRGLLSLPLVILVAFVGSVAGDQTWFHLGHRFGKPFIAKRPAWQARTAKVGLWLDRLGWFFVVAFRFIYGIRTVTPAYLGASGYPAGRFLVLNTIGAAVWAAIFGSAGYLVGAGLGALLHRATHVEEAIIAAIIVTVVAGLIVKRVREKKEPHGKRPATSGV